MFRFNVWDYIAHILVIIGALNWGLIGFFDYDLVSGIFGFGGWFNRCIFALVGLAGLYVISFFFRNPNRK